MLDKTAVQSDLWFGTRGPPDAPIVLVGESWGAEEARAQRPFVGSSGTELERILQNAKVDSTKILFTNVVAAQPSGNETWRFFEPKSLAPARVGGLAPGHLVRSEVARLYSQILSYPRQLVISTGNYALWALSHITGSKVLTQSNGRKIASEFQTWTPSGILDWRGSMWFCEPHTELLPSGATAEQFGGIKLLPIVHPAAIMRAWYLRDPTIHDLRNRVPQALRDDWRGDYEFYAPPTYTVAVNFFDGILAGAEKGEVWIAADIETARGLVTCLGIATSASQAVSIPFVRKTAQNGFDSWWTPEQEARIVGLLRRIFVHPNIRIFGQNFIYDTQYIQRFLGVTPHLDHDTMLHQNVCFPGTPKALDYLSSLYCRYHWYWKEDHKEWDTRGTIEDLLHYNAMDCVRTWEIGTNQRQVTSMLGMEDQFAFKMKTNDLCLRMMNRGVLFDQARRTHLLVELQAALAELHKELLEIIPQAWVAPVGKRSKSNGGGEIYWMTSDRQQKTLFYDVLGFKHVTDPKTGSLTTGKKAMGQFRLWYPEFTGLIDRLQKASSVENTIGVLMSQIDPDGRIRCSYNPGGTETHRLSSSKNAFGGGTNLQNLTKGEEDE